MEKGKLPEESKNIDEMRAMLKTMLNEDAEYAERLEAYEFLSEDCGQIVEEMLPYIYTAEGDTGKMLMEVLANYKDNKAVYMGLVSWLYKGDDVALFAKLLGGYGNEAAIDVLKGYVNEFETDYNEYMEIRNAVEELGGDFDFNEDFSEDPLYRYLKGLDEDEPDSRRSPFEDLFSGKTPAGSEDGECEDCGDGCCGDDCDCHHHDDEDCGCHHDDGCDCHKH